MSPAAPEIVSVPVPPNADSAIVASAPSAEMAERMSRNEVTSK